MTKVKFNTKPHEDALIKQIVDRAVTYFGKYGIEIDSLSLTMDLAATHSNGCPLDFDRLLSFDESSFAHDIGSIMRHINRRTGKIENFFLPRCHFTGSTRKAAS